MSRENATTASAGTRGAVRAWGPPSRPGPSRAGAPR